MSDSLAKQLDSVRVGDRPFNEWMVFALSIVAVTGGLLAARGNGLPTVSYVLAALLGVPALVFGIGRYVRRRTRSVQCLALLTVALLSFTAAYISSRRSPSSIFESAFSQPPPPGVRLIDGRIQCFDGQICLLHFTCTPDVLQTILAMQELKSVKSFDPSSSETINNGWRALIGMLGTIADPAWQTPPRLTSPQAYERQQDLGNSQHRHWSLIYDAASGDAWLVYSWT